MRIAILTDLPWLYDESAYLRELELKMKKQGFEIQVFVIRSPHIFHRLEAGTGLMRMAKATMLIPVLKNFDLIHIQFTFPIGTIMTLLARLQILRKPIVIHTHGYDIFTVPSIEYGLRRTTFGKFLASFTWKGANKIIVVCEKAKTEVVRTVKDDQRVDLIYNGIDEKTFSPSNTSDIPEDIKSVRDQNDLLFLSIASVVPVKNHSKLIKSFNQLVEKYKSKYNIKLLLIGGYHAYKVSLDKSDSVVYLGHKPRSSLPSYYNAVDAFILPSLSEAHPWSILEAMSCERVVLASDAGGIPETLQDGRFLVNPLKTSDIMSKMAQILEMGDKERRQVGMSNRKKVLQSFTLQIHLDRLKNIYQSILD